MLVFYASHHLDEQVKMLKSLTLKMVSDKNFYILLGERGQK